MEEISINKIVRSRRRTIALIITEDAALVVHAPFWTPLDYIKGLVRKKSVWIKRKISETSSRPKPMVKEYLKGEEYLYLGRTYQLCLVADAAKDIELKDQLYLSERALPQAHDVVKRWYKSEALKIIVDRCEWYAKIISCKPVAIKITEAQKRWGSCSSKGRLNFSWRLVMAPLEVIDYIIVHEMAHIGQLNHSREYWSKVREILPDYKNQEKWLKDHGRLLTI